MTAIADERHHGGIEALPELRETREIPRPTGRREPMKANVYERISKQVAQLVPIFPYDDAGALVPCGAILWGGGDREYGQFFHWNTVSEIVLTWGSHEAMLGNGQIMALQKFHGVNSFLKDQSNPEAFAVVTVTQHQSTEAGQREAVVAKCRGCKQEFLRYEFPAAPSGAPDFDPGRFGSPDDVFPQFSTTSGTVEFQKIINSAEGRVCPECGFENPPLPDGPWRWKHFVDQTRVVNAAYHALTGLAEEQLTNGDQRDA